MPGDRWSDRPFQWPETEATSELDALGRRRFIGWRVSDRFAFTVVVVLC